MYRCDRWVAGSSPGRLTTSPINTRCLERQPRGTVEHRILGRLWDGFRSRIARRVQKCAGVRRGRIAAAAGIPARTSIVYYVSEQKGKGSKSVGCPLSGTAVQRGLWQYGRCAMAEHPLPSIVAALLCDRVITEAGTNKKTVVGVFDTLHAVQLPFQVQFSLYIRLTDAQGRYRFEVKIVHLETDTPLAGARTSELQMGDPLGYYELVMPFPSIPFPTEGRYEFQIYANDVYVGRTTINAIISGGLKQ